MMMEMMIMIIIVIMIMIVTMIVSNLPLSLIKNLGVRAYGGVKL
jgi:hypothetical protein